ncbi:SURF1 family protein [Microbulbifer yueqingensis]|uniref:SURF1-like protein n=1 Tax=Microbulbifer yueqingensis TaxID=658219 RepID=A0A1G9BYG4_9GAMM|nr:SURF1 family protein [Microbulbifer yueqingensis]SDK44204.1 Cytochrome oxidase assembly protein ShyY1 [Microbulbifer yueqingensis]
MTVHTNPVRARQLSGSASVAPISNWPLTLFSGLLLPILVALGVWQLQRAEEKQALVSQLDARLSAQPENPAGLDRLQPYMPVRLQGYFTGEYFYLDNRTRDGRVGYEILQVFVSGKQRWLVNRGWLAAGSSRAELPAVTWPLAAKVVTGFLYPVLPAGEESPAANSGSRIQAVDERLTASLELAQPRWTIRLLADSDTALLTDWQMNNSPPERHRAYAWQWFAMAAALVVLWLLAATRLPVWLRKRHGRGTGDPEQ